MNQSCVIPSLTQLVPVRPHKIHAVRVAWISDILSITRQRCMSSDEASASIAWNPLHPVLAEKARLKENSFLTIDHWISNAAQPYTAGLRTIYVLRIAFHDLRTLGLQDIDQWHHIVRLIF